MKFPPRARVNFEGECAYLGQGDNPEPVGVQGAANEEIHLTFGVPFFRRQPLGELELVVPTAGGV